MNDDRKSTRLGDLLVERGLISRLQLAHAIELQEVRRQHAIKVNAPNSYTQQFGELLIELGFINRSQLKSSLSWQRRLRKTTAMMVFVAPLLTAACGGGSGGLSPNNTQSPTLSSQTLSSESVNIKPTSSSVTAEPVDDSSSTNSSIINSSDIVYSSAPSSGPNSSSAKSATIISPVISSIPSSSSLSSSLPASSAPGSVSNSSIISSSSVRSVSSSSRASSISSVSSSTAVVSGAVYFKWTPPNQRENGEFLDITEVGGYELRYKRKSENHYTSIIINNSYIDTYYIENLQGEYEFEIAAFDVGGFYSTFVKLKPI